MTIRNMHAARRAFVLGLASLAVAPLGARDAFAAAWSGAGLLDLLTGASDRALDKLAAPGAFYADPAVRIGLPVIGKAGRSGGALGSLLGMGEQLGFADGLTRKLNDAAGSAARAAKPAFHDAIHGLSLRDVPDIVSRNDGATQYLRGSAGPALNADLRPLVDSALGDVGAFGQLDTLSRRHKVLAAAGITRSGLTNSVTEQALNGIFRYIGNEEAQVRANPVGTAGSLLKGILGD